MPDARDELIAALAAQAPQNRFEIDRHTWTWVLLTGLYVIGATLATGPLRPGAVTAVFLNPQFSLEVLLGIFCFAALAMQAFKLAVPGARSTLRSVVTWSSLALWLLVLALAFLAPAFEPSMFGKRDHCVVEAFLYSAPPAVVGLWLLAKGYVLAPARAAFAIGAAAGLLPVVMMQIACMYEPFHTFGYHVAPGAVTGLVTGILGMTVLKNRARNPG